MTLTEIATAIRDSKEKINLIYAFNSTGKTRLAVAYKDATKAEDGAHSGVYYNAFSEDLFVWDNDDENDGANVRLEVRPSSLSKFHTLLTEDNVRDKLNAFKPKFGFSFKPYEDDPEKGIESISFFVPNQNPDVPQPPIKISRGEERIFVWCFFLALFEVEGWADKQSSHFFIYDPVSSLDDHNIFVTVSTLYDLIDAHHTKRKIIITTHHIGLFSILADMLTKGEKAGTFQKSTSLHTLSSKSGELTLESCRNDVFLYHLRLLQVLEQAQRDKDIRAYHFALLRQILENVASFLGVPQFGFVLQQIGIDSPDEIATIVNTMSHMKVYYFESDELVPDTLEIFEKVFNGLKEKYQFVLHAKKT